MYKYYQSQVRRYYTINQDSKGDVMLCQYY